MRIVNYTPLPLDDLLAFAAKGVNDAGVELHIKNEPHHPHAYAYHGVPAVANVAKTARYLITIHLFPDAADPRWPKKYWNGHGLKRFAALYPEVPFDDWKDCVVYIAAHEFRHIWQQHRRRRAWREGRRASGKCEHDACVHGVEVLNKYRVATGRQPIPRVKQPNPFLNRPARPKPVAAAADPAPAKTRWPAYGAVTRSSTRGIAG